MKPVYKKPEMITYDRDDILALMGPIRTQYCGACSNVEVAPSAFLQGKIFDAQDPFTLAVDTGNCPQFRQVEVSIPGSSPFVFFQFNRTDGTEAGGTWSIDIDNFQFLGDRGTYDVVVTLIDGQGNSGGTCQTSIEVE